MKISRVLSVFLLLWGVVGSGVAVQRSTQEAIRDEEVQDYFRKWLNEDVAYIITDEERDVFGNLTSPEEKERFIEQFWLRRDPDTSTRENEYKIEHYRRIAYSNEWFGSGEAGWKTDRGRIYIILGPPTEVTRYQGGQYERPMEEGGGITTTYPFEKWFYPVSYTHLTLPTN